MVVSGSVPGQKSPLRRLQAVQQCLAQYGRTAHMASLPSEEILAAFGIALVAPLGGRLNQHWLVETRRERLVLRRWAQSADEIDYELRLLEQIAALGWPVAPAVARPLELDGVVWTLAPFLPGDPPSQDDPLAEQRARGRLLAAFHADLAQLGRVKQRGSWRRCEEILQDAELERVLLMHLRSGPALLFMATLPIGTYASRMGISPVSSTSSWPTGIIALPILRSPGAESMTRLFMGMPRSHPWRRKSGRC
jgi:hypothetical protein